MRFKGLLLLIFTASIPSLTHAEKIAGLQRLDVFALEWVAQPALSPDARRIVYVRRGMDIMNDAKTSRLWLIDTDGSRHRPLTGRDTNESRPVWSNDGTRIAYLSKTKVGTEIFVYWTDTRKSTRITSLARTPGPLSWSPDDSQLAFSMLVPEAAPILVSPPEKPKGAKWADTPKVTTRLKHEQDGSGHIEPGYRQYFVVDAIGGSPRQVSQGAFQHRTPPQWSRDGLSLVFSANRHSNWEHDYRNSEIYRLDVKSGATQALTSRQGPDASPVVSPDGKRIAYLSFADKIQTYQLNKIRVMNADGTGKFDLLPELDRNVSAIQWHPNGRGLFYQFDDRGDTKIGFTSLNGKQRLIAEDLGGTALGRPYAGGSFSVGGNGVVAYTHSTPYRPAELAVSGKNPESTRIITQLNQDLMAFRELGKVEELWYKSSIDQRDIQGWIIKPPGYDESQTYPLLVENHGGPVANYGPRFSPELQLYASAGYLVFYPNPRGSTGYGEEFGNLLYHNYPGEDYQDVMDGVDTLIAKGLAKEGNLFVTGGSAGGIMTAWMIGKNQRFKAAAVIKPVMNWISKTLTADNYYAYANYRYPGQPWENIAAYMKFSPISLVGNIETPTLVMVGGADLRTPLSEAKQLYHALKIREIDTALVEMPGAPHFIAGKPSQLIAKIDHILAWFARYRE